MKKLMIAAATIVSAIAANAATVNWGSGDIYGGAAGSALDGTGGGSLVANGTTMYYVFTQIDSADYDTWLSMSQADKYAAFTADGADSTVKIGGNTYTAFAAKAATEGSAAVSEGNYSKNDMAYGVCIVTYDPDKDGVVDFYSASEAQGKVTTTGKNLSGMALMNDAGDPTTWTAAAVPPVVPEPTTGLLVLLGMAGLALRRRA